MKRLFLSTLIVSLVSLTGAKAEQNTEKTESDALIHIVRGGTMPQSKGAEANFTGDVSVDRLFPANDPLSISGGYVRFAKGARTAWHTHPEGQMLIVTAGSGRVQQWGKPMLEVQQGDVVWFPAGVKHWHGASSDSSMTHIALAKIVDGKSATWMEKVSNDQYNGK